MRSLFFYGTLRHLAFLETVLGRSAQDLDVAPATFSDHRVAWAKDQSFPMILADPGCVA